MLKPETIYLAGVAVSLAILLLSGVRAIWQRLQRTRLRRELESVNAQIDELEREMARTAAERPAEPPPRGSGGAQ